MASKKQQLLKRLAAEADSQQVIDKSLDAQAYRRATGKKMPRTMTPWEWEDWYAENGEPNQQGSPSKAALNGQGDAGLDGTTGNRVRKKAGWWSRVFFKSK